MSTTNDGGPAFPSAPHNVAHGMSLRDYFAARAMHQFFAGSAGMGNMDRSEVERQFRLVADFSYIAADAMLKARDA